MQFIALPNFKVMLALGSTLANKTGYDLSGNTNTLEYTSNVPGRSLLNMTPFMATSDGLKSAVSEYYCLPYASSASSIPDDTKSILNEVGTTTISYIRNSKGWTATINVTAVEGTKINSFFFVKQLFSNAQYNTKFNALIFAIKLDNPVTIDSTGTANFTFAIEF